MYHEKSPWFAALMGHLVHGKYNRSYINSSVLANLTCSCIFSLINIPVIPGSSYQQHQNDINMYQGVQPTELSVLIW